MIKLHTFESKTTIIGCQPDTSIHVCAYSRLYFHQCNSVPNLNVHTWLKQYNYMSFFFLNSNKVKEFVIHFWQTLPSHITAVLCHQVVVDLIALCDTILYRAICGLLIPGVLQPLPGRSVIKDYTL